MARTQLLVGVNVGINRLHSIIAREEASGNLRLMGEHRSLDVIRPGDQDSLVKRIRESILEASRDAQVDREDFLTIGIALPGQIDLIHENLLFAPNLNIANAAIVEALQQDFHCHIAIINDVAALGIGEQRIGEGKHARYAVYIYVSYGIGSSIIIDGKPYTGADNQAGEIGHSAVCFEGPVCSCKKVGCLEVFSSRRALAKALRDLYKEEHKTVLAKHFENLAEEPFDLSSVLIADAIEQGDELTIQVVERAATIFGIGVATVINFLNPNVIILGGDVIDEIDLFFDRAVASAKERSLPNSIKNVSIVRGALGPTSIAYGAAVFPKHQLEQAQRT